MRTLFYYMRAAVVGGGFGTSGIFRQLALAPGSGFFVLLPSRCIGAAAPQRHPDIGPDGRHFQR